MVGRDFKESTLPIGNEWKCLSNVALTGLPGEVVHTLEPYTEAHAAGLLADFLTSFGSACGPGPHVVADGARHDARLFVLLVGKTAKARKGTARAQVKRLFDAVAPDWSGTRVLGGVGSGEGLSPRCPTLSQVTGRLLRPSGVTSDSLSLNPNSLVS